MDKQLEHIFLAALEQNQKKLLRICSVYAKDSDDKNDLFQESLINIWQSMPSFQDKSSLGTWMFRITLNICMRLQERKVTKRDRFRSMNHIGTEHIQEDEPNHEEFERLEKLRNCIQKLNDVDKAITTLYLEELPYKEISEITGLTENTIAVRMKRIKIKLLNCINSTLSWKKN